MMIVLVFALWLPSSIFSVHGFFVGLLVCSSRGASVTGKSPRASISMISKLISGELVWRRPAMSSHRTDSGSRGFGTSFWAKDCQLSTFLNSFFAMATVFSFVSDERISTLGDGAPLGPIYVTYTTPLITVNTGSGTSKTCVVPSPLIALNFEQVELLSKEIKIQNTFSASQ